MPTDPVDPTEVAGFSFINGRAIGASDLDINVAGGMVANPMGNVYFVDSAAGSDSNNGLQPGKALLTIAAAVALAAAGDTIFIKGSFTEAVVVDKAGLKIIGAGTGPKVAQWTSAVDTASCTISAAYVEIRNIYFKPPAYSADATGLSAILLSGANYARIMGCRFQGQTASYRAIYSPVCNSDNVTIADCDFMYMNTGTYGAGILGVEAGGLSYSGWKILRNTFSSCVTAININGRCCLVKDNVIAEYGIAANAAIGAVLALGIDLSGTSSGANMVVGNQLGGTYNATLYKIGASGDQWGGNLNVLTGGVTAANPS